MSTSYTSFFSSTPTASSAGEMPKFWDSDHKILYKADRSTISYDVYSEIICSRLAALLGLNHVSYTIVTIDQKEYCKCENFILRNEILITSADLQKYSGFTQDKAITFIKDVNAMEFCQMLLFDFLVVNTDRHHNNFGILKNTLTGKTRLTPLFDHNAALYSDRINDANEPFCNIDYWLTERMYHNGIGKLPERVKQIDHEARLNDYFKSLSYTGLADLFIDLPRLSDTRRLTLQNMLWSRYQYLEALL